jgi:uncharacterized protein YgiM (DUF1202 family)
MKRRILAVTLALLLGLSCTASAVTMGVVSMPTKDGSVFIRNGGGTKYPAIGYALHGDLLRILKEGKRWDRVTMVSGIAKGKTGWMYNKYITNLRDISNISGWGALAHIKTKYAASTVHLRKGPGTGYGIRGYLKRDDLLIVLNKHSKYWYEVQVANTGMYGYVYANYIANGAPGKTTGNVNLRAKRSTSSKVKRVIPYGSTLTVLVVYKSWSKVRYNGTLGYVWNGYLKFR